MKNTLLEIKRFHGYTNLELAEHIGLSLSSLKRFMGTGDTQSVTKDIVDKVTLFIEENKIEPMLIDNFKKQKTIQTLQDSNRVLRKTDRKNNRQEYLFETLMDEIRALPLAFEKKKVEKVMTNNYDGGLILQLSDLHYGKCFEMRHNRYSTDVAETRLVKLFCKTREHCKVNNITDIVIAFTGDMFHLNHRIDQLHESEVPRSRALVQLSNFLTNQIGELAEEYNVKIMSVVGNESRVSGHEYLTNNKELACDNFDYLLLQILKMRLGNVEFLNDGDYFYDILKFKNKNILLFHGDKVKNDKDVELMKARVLEESGILIDYCLYGHIHESLINKRWARSSSLVGSDGYSANGLNISGNDVSQNITIIKNGITTFRVDCS